MALGAQQLGLDSIAPFIWARYPLLTATICAAIALRGRHVAVPALWIAAAAPWIGMHLVLSTPLAGALARSLVREDPLRPAAAIVVLSSDIRTDGTPDRGMQLRLDHAYRLIEGGYARRLVVPRLGMRTRSYVPAVLKQLKERDLECTVEQLGAVYNTHDEVVEIDRYLKRPGNGPVILVTEALHMRRVTALCRRRGVVVLRSPSGYAHFDYRRPAYPEHRMAAFRVWLYEVYYYELNRLLGWV